MRVRGRSSLAGLAFPLALIHCSTASSLGGAPSHDASPGGPTSSHDASITRDATARAKDATSARDASTARDTGADAKWAGYDPYTVTPASALEYPRGFSLHRGTIHLHSNYSWDADDQLGFINDAGLQDYDGGTLNEPYYQDMRKGLCETEQEFAFLTDHVSYFPDFEYPDVLLYRADLGDQLIMQNGNPVAVELACPGAAPVLLSAGCDYNTLAIGLDQHVASTPAARKLVYGQATPEAYATLRQNGALVLAAYLPRWIPASDASTVTLAPTNQLLTLQFDALENYNPLFNFDDKLGAALALVLAMNSDPSSVPVPELGLIAIFEENPIILAAWSQMAQASRVPSFLGSNAHENVLPNKTPDGERLDSYRRMMHWWANYAMLPAGTAVTTATTKAAIAAGRTFGSFDYLGYPTGFDFHAEAGGQIYEMGDQVPPGVATTLVATAPTVYGLKPINQVPVITVSILQAQGTGWTVIASGSGTVTAPAVANGVYRAEVQSIPNHLIPNLGTSPQQYLTAPLLWVYGNTIWVGTSF